MRILHCLRAPVGGLFRHVGDLARAQAALGHEVGVACDSLASDGLTEARLAALAGELGLGLHRLAMSREVGLADVRATRSIRDLARVLRADVIHGHGAKGGAYARLAARACKRAGLTVSCFYTPHGGSLHYAPTSLKGRGYMAAERALQPATDGIIFESEYARRTYQRNVGLSRAPARVVANGLLPADFDLVVPEPDASELLFVGELRHLKGVDLLLSALAETQALAAARLLVVGDGPDGASLRARADASGLASRVTFAGAMPARHAFAKGRVLVVPSRAESLPYIVLEAAAAGLPVVATDVGGVSEIVAGTSTKLVPPDDVAALARALCAALADPAATAAEALALRDNVARRFTVATMTTGILDFYRSVTNR